MQQEQINKICVICADISESIEYLDDAMGNQSPIHHPTFSIFKPPNKMRNAFELENSEVVSIEDDINAFSNPFAHYKCFKCFGIINSNIGCSQALCDECEGSEYIRQNHPMANLLQKVLKIAIPSMKNATKSGVQCRGCEVWRERQDCYLCDQCSDFAVCSRCYELGRYSHPNDHRLQLKRIIPQNMSFRLRQNIPTMKKISEVFQLEQNNLDEEELQCSICKGSFDECYEACTTCESQGADPFQVCLNCIDSNRMRHPQQHVLEVRTHSKESMLPGLSAKPSSSSTNGLESYDEPRSNWPLRENLKRTNGSIVEFGQMDLDQSTQMQDEGRYSVTEDWPNGNSSFIDITTDDACNPETPETVSYVKKCAIGRNQSMVAISMQQSIEPCDLFLHPEKKIPSHALLGFTLRNSREQILSKSSTDEEYIFTNYQCDNCHVSPIRNKRYHCNLCENYDLCIHCYLTSVRDHHHSDFTEIDGSLIRKQRDQKMEKLRDTSIKGRSSISSLRLSTVSVRL